MTTPNPTTPVQTHLKFLSIDPTTTNTALTPSPTLTPFSRDALKKSNPLLSIFGALHKGNTAIYNQSGPISTSQRHAFDPSHVHNLIASQSWSASDSIPLLALGHRNPNLLFPLVKSHLQRMDAIQSLTQSLTTAKTKSERVKLEHELRILKTKWLHPTFTNHHLSSLGPTLQLLALTLGSNGNHNPSDFDYNGGKRGEEYNVERGALGWLIGDTKTNYATWGEFLSWCEYHHINAGCGNDLNGKLPGEEEMDRGFGGDEGRNGIFKNYIGFGGDGMG